MFPNLHENILSRLNNIQENEVSHIELKVYFVR